MLLLEYVPAHYREILHCYKVLNTTQGRPAEVPAKESASSLCRAQEAAGPAIDRHGGRQGPRGHADDQLPAPGDP